MKQKFRLFRRGRVFWCHDSEAGRQESLDTKDRTSAKRLLHARNESHTVPFVNLQMARAYMMAADPKAASRTWRDVLTEILKLKQGETQRRWVIASKDKAYASINDRLLIETRAEHLLRSMELGKVSTNAYLRRIHNFALDMSWLPAPIIPKRQRPAIRHRPRRAITFEEHEKIIARELNPERKAFYELAWHIGASQSDIAFLRTEDIDWGQRVISYQRKKTGEYALIRFDETIEAILRRLPKDGPLFPYLRTVRPGDRATEFMQRTRGLDIKGVSLHSYRYAWAERARKCGYPERFAQEALGHNSKAVHRAYARKAQVVVPPLSVYELQQVTDLGLEIRFPGPVVLTNPASIELPPTATVANL
jgi:hypothetical protein